MRILTLLIVLSNGIAVILAFVYHIVNNKLVKEYDRRMKLIYSVCNEARYANYNKGLNRDQMNDILFKIINIIERGYRL